MTTIVVDRDMGYMAADLMATANDGEVAMSCDTKIESINIGGDHYLVGAAGMEGPAEHLDESYGFSIVVLGPEGIQVVDQFMRPIPIHSRWYAAGSGGTIAWAVLEAGCGIDKAMQTAIKMDPNSGFGYQVRHVDPEKRKHDKDVR